MNISNFYSGTSGLVLPVPNKSKYPPEFRESSRLQFYSSLFNSIEINSTFYKIPMARTIQRWSTEVPADFRFTFKIPKSISHAPELKFQPGILHQFLEVIGKANTHAGCILLQFPAQLKAACFNEFYRLISELRHNSDNWGLAVEFRDLSWYEERVIELMRQINASIVIHDFNSTKQTLPEIITSSIIYLRYHGPEKGYRGSYTQNALKKDAMRIDDWIKNQYTVYAYFNNTLGEAVNNLQTLNSYL